MEFATIDFEASCLPRHGRSFPIEVGVTSAIGTRSWLIKPSPSWSGWDWTDEAAGLHGIDRAQLDKEGLSPRVVLAEISLAIADRRVIADSMIDAQWLKTLADVAGAAIPFTIEYVGAVFDELGATSPQIIDAQRHADLLCPARHRAGADARWLWLLMSKIENILKDDVPTPVGRSHGALPSRPQARATHLAA